MTAHHKWTCDQEEYVLTRSAQGAIVRDIANEMGLTFKPVWSKLRAMKRDGRKPGFKKSEFRQWLDVNMVWRGETGEC